MNQVPQDVCQVLEGENIIYALKVFTVLRRLSAIIHTVENCLENNRHFCVLVIHFGSI